MPLLLKSGIHGFHSRRASIGRQHLSCLWFRLRLRLRPQLQFKTKALISHRLTLSGLGRLAPVFEWRSIIRFSDQPISLVLLPLFAIVIAIVALLLLRC